MLQAMMIATMGLQETCRAMFMHQPDCVPINPKFMHQPDCVRITCRAMLERNSSDPSDCPIYEWLRCHGGQTQTHLDHMECFTHLRDEFKDKPVCRFKDECWQFLKVEQGGNNVSDLCHMKLYRHPPRSRRVDLAENVRAMIVNQDRRNLALDEPSSWTHSWCVQEDEAGRKLTRLCFTHSCYVVQNTVEDLKLLLAEVRKNGFASDLRLFEDGSSILDVVDKKLKHPRHLAMEHPLNHVGMLALVLYTSCDCNYDLCKSQRSGDYKKWKYFDQFLGQAIKRLSSRERGSYPVFTALNKVMLENEEIECGWFPTYVSASVHEYVAMWFIRNTNEGSTGMLIEIDQKFKQHVNVLCCDVSWISKFEDEAEVLFARSTSGLARVRLPEGASMLLSKRRSAVCWTQGFGLKISDTRAGVQKVRLTISKQDAFCWCDDEPKVNGSKKEKSHCIIV